MQRLVEAITEELEDLTVKLRSGNGLDVTLLESLTAHLQEYAEEHRRTDSIPKAMAEVFFEAYPALEASAFMYKAPEALAIREASTTLGKAIREILTS